MAIWVLTTSIGVAKVSFMCLQGAEQSADCCSETANGTENYCSDLAPKTESCCALDVEVFRTDYICLHQNETKSPQLGSLSNQVLDDSFPFGIHADLSLIYIGCEDPPWLYQPPIHLRLECFLI